MTIKHLFVWVSDGKVISHSYIIGVLSLNISKQKRSFTPSPPHLIISASHLQGFSTVISRKMNNGWQWFWQLPINSFSPLLVSADHVFIYHTSYMNDDLWLTVRRADTTIQLLFPVHLIGCMCLQTCMI